jgi:arylformamidase
MPYVLCPPIHIKLPGLWGEGAPFSSEVIYDITSTDLRHPPVHYNSYTIKPHSIPHIDAPGHIIPHGKTVDFFFHGKGMNSFFGETAVVKLTGEKWQRLETESKQWLWRISKNDLQEACYRIFSETKAPQKIFITAESAPITEYGFHDSQYILVLSEEAAQWLISIPGFNAFGTSWKSSDFEPSSRERPIHKILFSQAILFEQLKLDEVPEGIFWLSAFPLFLQGATESPVTPVLFRKDEL